MSLLSTRLREERKWGAPRPFWSKVDVDVTELRRVMEMIGAQMGAQPLGLPPYVHRMRGVGGLTPIYYRGRGG